MEKKFDFSDKTIKNILDNFKTFLNYLRYDLEIIDTVPAFPTVETPQPKTRWLTTEVQRRVFESIPEDDKPIFAFLMLSGSRPSEARALKCKDINLVQGVINISSTFSGRVYREKRKGRNAKSVTIPIHPEVLHYIKSRVESNLSGAYLFINSKTGLYYSENKLRKIWNQVREKVNLDKSIRLYDATRHSVASQLINKGVPLLSVSRLLGHSSTKMTEKYAHNDLGRLKIDISNLSLKEATVTRLSPAEKAAL
ncbi:MAG: site-specific integrase [Candidatus Brocadiales bacterium]|nr:site-specific integrase [Candidatus Brocadiales bacterium]